MQVPQSLRDIFQFLQPCILVITDDYEYSVCYNKQLAFFWNKNDAYCSNSLLKLHLFFSSIVDVPFNRVPDVFCKLKMQVTESLGNVLTFFFGKGEVCKSLSRQQGWIGSKFIISYIGKINLQNSQESQKIVLDFSSLFWYEEVIIE